MNRESGVTDEAGDGLATERRSLATKLDNNRTAQKALIRQMAESDALDTMDEVLGDLRAEEEVLRSQMADLDHRLALVAQRDSIPDQISTLVARAKDRLANPTPELMSEVFFEHRLHLTRVSDIRFEGTASIPLFDGGEGGRGFGRGASPSELTQAPSSCAYIRSSSSVGMAVKRFTVTRPSTRTYLDRATGVATSGPGCGRPGIVRCQPRRGIVRRPVRRAAWGSRETMAHDSEGHDLQRSEVPMTKGGLLRMDNVGIVVSSLDDAISFFAELGLKLEGRAMVEGEWAGRVTGLGDQQVEIATMVTPDGHSRLELSQFLTPPVVSDHRNAPVNSLGYLRAMFTVSDIDDTLARLRMRGARLVGDVVEYEDSYRLCYIRSPEGVLVGLAEEIGTGS